MCVGMKKQVHFVYYLYRHNLFVWMQSVFMYDKQFRNPRAWGCSIPSAAKALLRAWGFLNRLVTAGQDVKCTDVSMHIIICKATKSQ